MPVTSPSETEFTIQVDSREQSPYLFDNMTNDDGSPLWVWRNEVGLKSGDYSIKDMEDQIAVERKSHIDFLGSITKGRDRLMREFERLQELERAAIVVECDWNELLRVGHSRSQVTPKTIQRTIVSWTQRFPNVHWFLCMDKRHAEITTFQYLNQFWKLKQKREI